MTGWSEAADRIEELLIELRRLQNTDFACRESARAIVRLQEAKFWLREAERQKRGE